MNSKFIPVNTPKIGAREKELVLDCLDSGWISSEGSYVKEFEEKFAKLHNKKYGVSVTNGTSALDITFESLGIKAGDEVIIPTFTIISCIHYVLRIGAIPIFVDCDLYSWNMNIKEVQKKITSKTKAILAVHIYGLAVDLDPLKKICLDNDIFLVEDTAEAIGLNYKNTLCGSHGIASTFSFYPNKHITTGEGGMVLTDDGDIYSKLLKLRNLCFEPKKRFYHNEIGWNLRMTNIQAALGIGQLESLEENILRKRDIGKRYKKNLSQLKNFYLPLDSLEYSLNIYWVFGLVVKNNIQKAEIIINLLKEKNIGSRPFFYPLHKQPALSKFQIEKTFEDKSFANANYISEYGFYIPSGLGLLDSEIDYVSQAILEIDKTF